MRTVSYQVMVDAKYESLAVAIWRQGTRAEDEDSTWEEEGRPARRLVALVAPGDLPRSCF